MGYSFNSASHILMAANRLDGVVDELTSASRYHLDEANAMDLASDLDALRGLQIKWHGRLAQARIEHCRVNDNRPRTDHTYTAHYTYTGSGCAICGGRKEVHTNGT